MRFRKTYAAVIALFIVAVLAAKLPAQVVNNGTPTIIQAIQAVQSTLDGLVSTLNGFIAAQTPGDTSFTPAVVAFAPDSFICTATNVSAAARTIHIQMINGNTAAVLAENSATGVLVSPGLSTAAAFAAASTRAYCKFTVVDGNKTEIRGVLALFASGTASDKLTIAAE